MRIDPSLLQAFLAAARAGNFSRAAAAQHLTVSALSHRMRQLEQRLGRSLFARGPRGVSLTAEGQRLLDAVAGPLDALEQGLARLAVPRHDRLVLSTMASVAGSWLVPRLPRFLARHPQIELSLQTESALVDFERQSVDAALRFGPGGWTGVESTFLFHEWIAPVAAPALLQRLGRPGRDTLAGFPLLGDPGDRWQHWFARFGGQPPARFVAAFGDTESLQRAAVAGLGIALGRLTMVRPLLESGLLVLLTDERLQAEWSHYLVWPPRSRDHAGLAALREWLLEEAKADAEPPASPGARAGGAQPGHASPS